MSDAKVTKEEMAARLNGRQYGSETTLEDEADAKAAGLLIVTGYSDDNIELRGVVRDEAGAYGGGFFSCDEQGFIPAWEDVRDELTEEEARAHLKRQDGAIEITAGWDEGGYSWLIFSDRPFAPFDIMEDDEKFCRGIVVSMEASL